MSAERCDQVLLVQADFDGELAAAEAAALAAHRAGCAVCQDAAQRLADARRAARELPYHRAPASLRRALVAQLGAATPARRAFGRWREALSFGVGAALAASLILVALPRAPQSLVAELVAGHVRALQPGHLTDVVSTDRHTVKPWFDGRLDFAPPVKDLAAQGFPLIGGRLDYLDGRAVAALAYSHGKHPIDLFIWPGNGAGPAQAERGGYNLVHWSADGMSLWAVSDLERDQLEDFAKDWRAAP